MADPQLIPKWAEPNNELQTRTGEAALAEAKDQFINKTSFELKDAIKTLPQDKQDQIFLEFSKSIAQIKDEVKKEKEAVRIFPDPSTTLSIDRAAEAFSKSVVNNKTEIRDIQRGQTSKDFNKE